MKAEDFTTLDLNIARARVALSLAALLSIYLDPGAGGMFYLNKYALVTLVCHLIYSLIAYSFSRQNYSPQKMGRVFTVLDVFFAAAVTLFTEGTTSPSYVFFVFAIVATGFRTAFRGTLLVTVCCVMLYLAIIAIPQGLTALYVMRGVYLAITGYIIGFFGQERVKFESRLRQVSSVEEREEIARSLHDGYVQALAGVILRVGACAELLARHREGEALGELTELKSAVEREYDQIRSYIRSLASLDEASPSRGELQHADPRFEINANFSASGAVVEQILQIILEGARNTRRHAGALQAAIKVRDGDDKLNIAIDDDGVGFALSSKPPWTIASRVAAFGGRVSIKELGAPGAHLEIELPAT